MIIRRIIGNLDPRASRDPAADGVPGAEAFKSTHTDTPQSQAAYNHNQIMILSIPTYPFSFYV